MPRPRRRRGWAAPTERRRRSELAVDTAAVTRALTIPWFVSPRPGRFGEDDGEESDWDREAKQELEVLAKQSKLLFLQRLGDTHAKVFIKDTEFFVSTSFNWLSFRGDLNQTFREEWGTYVGVSTMVNDYHNRMVRVSERARMHSHGQCHLQFNRSSLPPTKL